MEFPYFLHMVIYMVLTEKIIWEPLDTVYFLKRLI